MPIMHLTVDHGPMNMEQVNVLMLILIIGKITLILCIINKGNRFVYVKFAV